MVVILRENAHGGAVDPKQPGKSHGANLVMLRWLPFTIIEMRCCSALILVVHITMVSHWQ